MGEHLVVFKHVTKSYEGQRDERYIALNEVDFTIDEGEIFALIGPNGAGKTSLIKILLSLSKTTAGAVFIDGMEIGNNLKVKELMGYVPEKLAFPSTLSALEVLHYYGKLRGVSRERCLQVLEQVGLKEFANQKVQVFSKGMTQRLGVAQAILAKPRLIVLDEPTSGLDPVGVAQFKQLMRDLNQEGLTILFTSHILSEVEQLADRVGIMQQGELCALDTLEGLMNTSGLLHQFEIDFTGSVIDLPAVVEVVGPGQVLWDGGCLKVTCTADKKIAVLEAVRRADGYIRDIRSREPSLEELFVRISSGQLHKKGCDACA